MTQKELFKALKETGLPVAYNHFINPPNPPYLVYLFSYSNDFMADDYNYEEIGNYQIELYTTKKDIENENKVENKLKEFELPYSKIETYIESEELFQILYQTILI